MKYILTLLFLILSAGTYAQSQDFKKPDFDLIEKNSTDKKSPLHYDKLFDRFNRADSTMTIEERRHLYYGYSFRDDYSPYGSSDAQEELNEILQTGDTGKETLEKLLEVTEKVLKDNPFSIRLREYRIFAFKELGMLKESSDEELRASIIIDAILSTGDGTSPETCFYVINTGNEYEIIDLLGFEFGGTQELTQDVQDYLTLAENSYNIEGLYFDVTRLFSAFKED